MDDNKCVVMMDKDEHDKCVVMMDNEEHASTDFVAVLVKEHGDATILYNTDALTLGMAMKLTAKAFIKCMNDLDPEQRDEIEGILGTMGIMGEEVATVEED